MTAVVAAMGNLTGHTHWGSLTDVSYSGLRLPAVFVDGSWIVHFRKVISWLR